MHMIAVFDDAFRMYIAGACKNFDRLICLDKNEGNVCSNAQN